MIEGTCLNANWNGVLEELKVKSYTAEDLAKSNGEDGKSCLVAVRGESLTTFPRAKDGCAVRT